MVNYYAPSDMGEILTDIYEQMVQSVEIKQP
jgi:hypothetical protein